jgi:hypothetical protein
MLTHNGVPPAPGQGDVEPAVEPGGEHRGALTRRGLFAIGVIRPRAVALPSDRPHSPPIPGRFRRCAGRTAGAPRTREPRSSPRRVRVSSRSPPIAGPVARIKALLDRVDNTGRHEAKSSSPTGRAIPATAPDRAAGRSCAARSRHPASADVSPSAPHLRARSRGAADRGGREGATARRPSHHRMGGFAGYDVSPGRVGGTNSHYAAISNPRPTDRKRRPPAGAASG